MGRFLTPLVSLTRPVSLARGASLTLLTSLALLLLPACRGDNGELVVSGRVETDRSYIGSKVGGRVVKVNFDEGDRVTSGDLVVMLDRAELEAESARAKAAAAQARAQLDLLLAGTRTEDIARAAAEVEARRAELALKKEGFRAEEIREAHARRDSAKSTLDLAQKDLERAKQLYESGTIERQELDRRQTAFDTAQAELKRAEEQVALMESGSRPQEIALAEAQLAAAEAESERAQNGPRQEDIAAARAALDAATAEIERIETRLDETEIRAPLDALVETLDLHPGDLAKAGQTLAVLDLDGRLYVRCYVPERRLGDVKPGKKVSVVVDAYPGETFPGTIRSINADAEFTPRNVQTNEKRAELVFEMKVDITENADRLRPGMYADVTVPRSHAP